MEWNITAGRPVYVQLVEQLEHKQELYQSWLDVKKMNLQELKKSYLQWEKPFLMQVN